MKWKFKATWAATVETVNKPDGESDTWQLWYAAVQSQMYGNTEWVPNSPGFPLQPFYMYQEQYPPLHQGQSFPDSQNV